MKKLEGEEIPSMGKRPIGWVGVGTILVSIWCGQGLGRIPVAVLCRASKKRTVPRSQPASTARLAPEAKEKDELCNALIHNRCVAGKMSPHYIRYLQQLAQNGVRFDLVNAFTHQYPLDMRLKNELVSLFEGPDLEDNRALRF